MDTNHLHTFISVAEAGSFSLAAEKLHLTQPAVSNRIAQLEQQLATSLFNRIGKRVSLTEAGKVLLPRAKKLALDMEEARTCIRNLAHAVSGRLPIAASHHIGLHRLPPVLRDFSRSYPEVTMDISFLESEQAYRQIAHGELELAVVTLALEPVERIYHQALWTDTLLIMTSPDHPLTRRKPPRLDDLLDFPAILPGANTYTRRLVDQLFQSRNLALNVAMSTNYLETIKMMVAVGMAWSVLPQSMLDDSLHVLPVSDIRLRRKLGYIHHRDHTLSNAGGAFISELERHRG
jgi:DNA-binding transcriptional LysR family regulator